MRVAVLHADEDTWRNTEWSLSSACGLRQDTGRKPQWDGFEENRRETSETVSLDKPWAPCEVNDEVKARRKSGEQGSLVVSFSSGRIGSCIW